MVGDHISWDHFTIKLASFYMDGYILSLLAAFARSGLGAIEILLYLLWGIELIVVVTIRFH
jgi:hypothetical protein